MDRIRNKNAIRLILWSIIPIAFGITFSGLVVRAFGDQANSEETQSESDDNVIIAYLQKIKGVVGRARTNAGTFAAGINFSDILYPPAATYHLKDESLLPNVGASAYVVADADTGEIIIEKNSGEVYPIASVTKLMTALVSLEEISQGDYAKVSARAINTLGSSGNLKQGEKIKVSDLLYPLLLVSSNDAGEVLAEHKGREKFMGLMNDKALAIGMAETNYEDASGLSANNYSTAKDLFALTHYLFKNHKTVFNITTLDKYSLGGRTWNNANNRFSKRDDYLGGKTGYTDRAKRTGVSVFSTAFEGYDNRNVAIILLRTDNRTEDINNILDYLGKNVYFAYDEEIKSGENASVSLGFVGDIMMDRGVKTSVYKNFDGDYTKVFENASELQKPDIMFGNLEGPISDKGKNVGSKYSFRFEPETAGVLKKAGFDILSFANNHVGDWSDEAFLDTLGRLSENNLLFTGAGEDYEKAKKPVIIERSGIQIGFLGFSDVGPEWMKATDTRPGILLANDPNLQKIIEEAKSSVDVLVTSVHWGEEYKEHNKRQETLAKKMIDAGTDIVVGHHPHVAQDVQKYKDGLIIYSLGNFVFDQYFSEETMEGKYVNATVTRSGLRDYTAETFEINEKYQPVMGDGSEDERLYSFDRGFCPVGNSDTEEMFANVNKNNSVDEYVPEGLVAIKDLIKTKDARDICLTSDAAAAFKQLTDKAEKDGINLIVTSGFRSYEHQKALYGGDEDLEDADNADSIAKPGHSEHQLGTTVDLTSNEVGLVSASHEFDETKAYDWLKENAHEYGFVLSYPEGKNTGYIFEPWHWRYLGEGIAEEIRSSGLTIQEYLEQE